MKDYCGNTEKYHDKNIVQNYRPLWEGTDRYHRCDSGDCPGNRRGCLHLSGLHRPRYDHDRKRSQRKHIREQRREVQEDPGKGRRQGKDNSFGGFTGQSSETGQPQSGSRCGIRSGWRSQRNQHRQPGFARKHLVPAAHDLLSWQKETASFRFQGKAALYRGRWQRHIYACACASESQRHRAK